MAQAFIKVIAQKATYMTLNHKSYFRVSPVMCQGLEVISPTPDDSLLRPEDEGLIPVTPVSNTHRSTHIQTSVKGEHKYNVI